MARQKRSDTKSIHCGGIYSPLSEKDIVCIHKTSMDVFEQVGVKIAYKPVLELWGKAGADIDRDKMVAKIDHNTVLKCISSAPKEITLCGREEKNDIILSGTRTHVGTGGTALNILDLDTGFRRPTTIRDVGAAARVVDACGNIDFFVISCFPTELKKPIVDINRFYAAIKNTSKHIMGGIYTLEGLKRVARMAKIIAGSEDAFKKRPFISMITSVMSPLLFDEGYTELMETACLLGIPLATSTAPMAGTTSPVTLAGTLVQMNVEALSGIITTQLLNPGHPTLYSVVPTTTDLRSGAFCFGSIEMGMMNAAAAQIARYYILPIYNTAGASESKIQDSQAMYESSMNILMSAMAGANYIHEAAGMLESGLTISLQSYILANDIIGMAYRVLDGITVDEEHLALDCIKRIGPAGNYISDEHTSKYMRNEFFFPENADRKPRMVWEADGQKSSEKRAAEMIHRYLSTHTPTPIDKNIESQLHTEFPEILEEAGKVYGE